MNKTLNDSLQVDSPLSTVVNAYSTKREQMLQFAINNRDWSAREIVVDLAPG